MLSGVRRTGNRQINTVRAHVNEVPGMVKSVEAERMVAGGEEGRGGFSLLGTKFQFGKVKRSLEVIALQSECT